ncbi:MAG TPA: hypothetical protein VF175_19190 [Lacipirellula sp.]
MGKLMALSQEHEPVGEAFGRAGMTGHGGGYRFGGLGIEGAAVEVSLLDQIESGIADQLAEGVNVPRPLKAYRQDRPAALDEHHADQRPAGPENARHVAQELGVAIGIEPFLRDIAAIITLTKQTA